MHAVYKIFNLLHLSIIIIVLYFNYTLQRSFEWYYQEIFFVSILYNILEKGCISVSLKALFANKTLRRIVNVNVNR